jgi:hypothetical protein
VRSDRQSRGNKSVHHHSAQFDLCVCVLQRDGTSSCRLSGNAVARGVRYQSRSCVSQVICSCETHIDRCLTRISRQQVHRRLQRHKRRARVCGQCSLTRIDWHWPRPRPVKRRRQRARARHGTDAADRVPPTGKTTNRKASCVARCVLLRVVFDSSMASVNMSMCSICVPVEQRSFSLAAVYLYLPISLCRSVARSAFSSSSRARLRLVLSSVDARSPTLSKDNVEAQRRRRRRRGRATERTRDETN